MLRLTRKINNASASDSVTLPWHERIKSRLRVTLESGREAGIFLERGTILRDGDLLCSEDGEIVRVQAADETLSSVSCRDPLLLARVCYHLGNRHVDVSIQSDRVCFLHDHVLDKMLTGMGLEVSLINGPFEPEAGAYGSQGGHHSHHHHG